MMALYLDSKDNLYLACQIDDDNHSYYLGNLAHRVGKESWHDIRIGSWFVRDLNSDSDFLIEDSLFKKEFRIKQ